MATTAIEVSTRERQSNWQGLREFDKQLPAVIFAAVSELAQEHGVVLRSLTVIERKSKAR